MRPRLAIALGVLVVGSVAHADERRTTITLGGMTGGIERTRQELSDVVASRAEPLVGPRISLGWEHAALELPAEPGYRFAGALVPELVAGAFIEHDRALMFVGAGVRAEIKMAQREMGLFRLSARGAAYLAARGLVVGDERKPYGEFTIGEYLLVGRSARIGVEGGLLVGRADEMTVPGTGREIGGMVQAYVGWQP